MDENIYDDNSSDGVVLPEDENPFRNELKTSPNIKISLSGYAAMVAVNETFSVVIGAKIHFFAPTRVNEAIEFDARSHFNESKKREVRVIGKTSDIKVFEGTFQVVILDDHIFKIYKTSLQRQAAQRKNEEKRREEARQNA